MIKNTLRSHLAVSRPGHQADREASGKSVLVAGRVRDIAARGVDAGRVVAKVPRQGHRCDGGDGWESHAAVDALQWEGLKLDEEVHSEDVQGQSPAAFLTAEGAASEPVWPNAFWNQASKAGFLNRWVETQ